MKGICRSGMVCKAKMGKILRKILTNAGLIAAGAMAGLLALLLVYCIPTDQIQVHVWQSLPLLEEEFTDSELITGNSATLTGNFTDCLMLENAIYTSEEHSLLEQILFMYRGESYGGDGWAPGYSLVDYLEGTKQYREVEYSRYWHGYLVVLRPLFYFTTFSSIRILASAVQLLLVGYVLFLCFRRKENALGFAFLTSVPFFYFIAMPFSLSLSICFYVLSVALIVQLNCHDQLEKRNRYGEFFLIVGMAVSYFDFLTYPLVCLGFPLCVALYLSNSGWKSSLRKFVSYSTQWCVGYIGMWAGKWVLADLLVGSNTISDALQTVLVRTGVSEVGSPFAGFLHVLKKNLQVYQNWGFYLLLLGVALILVKLFWKNRWEFGGRQGIEQGMVLLLVALLPLVWLFFTQNHSEQHYMYTCKIFTVTVFAGICAVDKILVKQSSHEKAYPSERLDSKYD